MPIHGEEAKEMFRNCVTCQEIDAKINLGLSESEVVKSFFDRYPMIRDRMVQKMVRNGFAIRRSHKVEKRINPPMVFGNRPSGWYVNDLNINLAFKETLKGWFGFCNPAYIKACLDITGNLNKYGFPHGSIDSKINYLFLRECGKYPEGAIDMLEKSGLGVAALDRYLEPTWTDSSGKVWLVKEMTLGHLVNCIKYMDQFATFRPEKRQTIMDEINKRGVKSLNGIKGAYTLPDGTTIFAAANKNAAGRWIKKQLARVG